MTVLLSPRWLLCGTGLQRCYWGLSVTPVLSTCGVLLALLLRWSTNGHFFTGTPKLTNSLGFSGQCASWHSSYVCVCVCVCCAGSWVLLPMPVGPGCSNSLIGSPTSQSGLASPSLLFAAAWVKLAVTCSRLALALLFLLLSLSPSLCSKCLCTTQASASLPSLPSHIHTSMTWTSPASLLPSSDTYPRYILLSMCQDIRCLFIIVV